MKDKSIACELGFVTSIKKYKCQKIERHLYMYL